jgi:phosphatidylserine decarboxylase
VPVAVQAVPFLLVLGVLAAALGLAWGPWAASPALLLAGFVLYFFRDPERVPPAGEGLVLSPADGRVAAVETGPGGARVSIFLSVLDCHINRSPVGGVIREVRYTRGRYHPAWQGRASSENERNHLEITAPDGTSCGVTQIAGVLARRIVCTKKPGDRVERGERIGLIRFGSRTDLRLPPGMEPLLSVGARVRGGLTIVARAAAREARAASGGRR